MNSSVTTALSILSTFPKGHLCHSFCYGSAVFKQASLTSVMPMLDMVFVVNNTLNFHEENLKQNPHHYSALKYLGPCRITKIQEEWPANLYYNTLIPFKDGNIIFKYGILSKEDFVTDLLDWCFLYVSGRLHKPVQILIESSDVDLQGALRKNLFSAVHIALLMLPEKFSEFEFYQTIANISYLGDFRMLFGEDKNKVNNIVLPQIENFRDLYSGIVLSLKDFVYIPENRISQNCEQNIDPEARWHHLNNLPRVPQKLLVKNFNKTGGLHQDAEDVLRTVSYSPDISTILGDCLRKIVWNSSVKQSLKGFITAGIIKSIRYSSKKIYKMFTSIKKIK